jgi:type VI secretion system secreted protein Hcp
MAAVDYFLKLDGIEGESQDSKHSKEVEIIKFHFKGHQAGTTGSATSGGGKGRVKLDDLIIWKKVDKSSPKAFLRCCSGEPVKKVVLTGRKAGKDQQDYFTITMTDCVISLFEYGQPPSEDGALLPAVQDDWEALERIGFNYATIDYSYKEQKADGTLGGEIKGGWNATQNKAL